MRSNSEVHSENKMPRANVLDPERIAYWFFRLNGCFILENFLVHHPQRGYEGTDIDILATRFPHREELALSEIRTTQPMDDHVFFETSDHLIDIYLVEVKRGRMRINPSWLNPEKQNMERLLNAIGTFPKDVVEDVACQLRSAYSYIDGTYRVRYVAVGEYAANELPDTISTLQWQAILQFIYQRLHVYRNQKAQHSQWDWTGSRLYRLVQTNRGFEGEKRFVEDVLGQMRTIG